MNNTELKEKISQYLRDNPQYLDGRKASSLIDNRDRAQLASRLTAAGFTFEQKEGIFYLTNALVSPEWRTGGITGGSCWGGEANQPVDGDEAPAWLEEFLEKIAPEVSFLKFRRMREKCVKHEYTENEYYGNYTHYAFEVLKLEDIAEVLLA